MPMRYLKQDALDELKTSVKANLERYRKLGFTDVFDNIENNTRKLRGSFRLAEIKKLKKPLNKNDLFDPYNSKLIFTALANLNPLQAREERIWASLCHFEGLEYMRVRWPIPDDDKKAVTYILTHFFATSDRAIERDNGISRLWWMGFIAERAQGIKLAEALKVLMYRADVRAGIIERPTTSTSVPVFSAILKQLKISFDGLKILYKRNHFRDFMIEINSAGGVQLLDSLDSGHLDNLMKDIISNRLGLTKI